jgi:hypothetical protein
MEVSISHNLTPQMKVLGIGGSATLGGWPVKRSVLDTPDRYRMSWRTVARGLGKITKRRTKEFGWRVRERDGELMRDIEVQYYIPSPVRNRRRK